MARKVPKDKKLRRAPEAARPAAKAKKPAPTAKAVKAAPKPVAKKDAKAKPPAAKEAAKPVAADKAKLKGAPPSKSAPVKSTQSKSMPGKAVAGKDAKPAKPVKEPKAPKEPAVKKKRKGPGIVRFKAFWGVFNQMLKRVAVFEYAERKQADKKAADLSVSAKQPHFVQVVKEVIREVDDAKV